MKILVANNCNNYGIGDFIYFSFILIYDLHKKFNCEIYYYTDCLDNRNYMPFISSLSDIFSIETELYNKSYDIVIGSDFFRHHILPICNIKYDCMYDWEHGKLFDINKNRNIQLYNEKKTDNNYVMKIDNKCFQNIHQYMKNKFVVRNKFNLQKNTITITIGTNAQKNNGLTDKGFQKIISKLIENNKNIQFCTIGLSHHIVSDEFKYCLQKNYPHVLNLIDKDDGLLDVIDIIQSSKIFLTRCSGLKHMAGLFNSNIICIENPLSLFDFFGKPIFNGDGIKRAIIRIKNYSIRLIKIILFYIYLLIKYIFSPSLLFSLLFSRPPKDVITYSIKNEEMHPYYYERWAPISLNYTRITEYKKYNYFYNNFDYVYFYLLKAIQSVNDQ